MSKAEFDKLQKDYDELMRTHVMHLLVTSQLMGLRVPNLQELH